MMCDVSNPIRISPGAAATLACLYEATAPKPGNVHPGADFDDVTYADFVVSAVVVGPILERVPTTSVGQTVLEAVHATREAVGTNTNLGALLLLAPLAAVDADTPLEHGIAGVLDQLSAEDTRLVYQAIRLSAAGGLGRSETADVFDETAPSVPLAEVMRLAADRDLVARQYATRFADVFRIARWLSDATGRESLRQSIVTAHVRQLAAEPDTLILRKCGPAVAREASRRAAALAADHLGEPTRQQALTKLDAWLRADGHRRNPGTTADLIAAALFVLLREGRLHWTAWQAT